MKITETIKVSERTKEFKFDNGAWASVCIFPEDGDGSWEYQRDEDDEETYLEGSLWLDGKVVDYDGCYDLPTEVVLAIKECGYNVNDLED